MPDTGSRQRNNLWQCSATNPIDTTEAQTDWLQAEKGRISAALCDPLTNTVCLRLICPIHNSTWGGLLGLPDFLALGESLWASLKLIGGQAGQAAGHGHK